jgi:superfamily II DNA or RNA helicase
MLSEEGASGLLVDRYKFREMLDATPVTGLWPGSVVVVMSYDFAKQPDITDSLASAHWDMLIADEAHILAGVRGKLFRRVEPAADRVVLASATLMPVDASRISDAKVVEWQRDRLVDHDGKPLIAAPRLEVREVSFRLSGAEQKLSETVGELFKALKKGSPVQRYIAKILLRSFHSSPAALEGALRRAAELAWDQGAIDALLENTDEKSAEARSSALLDPVAAEMVRTIAGQALQELEAIQEDSKLGAFGRLLDDLVESERPDRRICVIADFRPTLYYLAADIEGRGLACPKLHGEMPYQARRESLDRFAGKGGILVATRDMMTEGLSLPDVTDLVLYDLPTGEHAMWQVLGRFVRLGRTSQLCVHVLAEPNSTDSALSTSLRLLQEIALRYHCKGEV